MFSFCGQSTVFIVCWPGEVCLVGFGVIKLVWPVKYVIPADLHRAIFDSAELQRPTTVIPSHLQRPTTVIPSDLKRPIVIPTFIMNIHLFKRENNESR